MYKLQVRDEAAAMATLAMTTTTAAAACIVFYIFCFFYSRQNAMTENSPTLNSNDGKKYPALFISIEMIALFLLILISVMFDSMVKSFTRLFFSIHSLLRIHIVFSVCILLRKIWMMTMPANVDDDGGDDTTMRQWMR